MSIKNIIFLIIIFSITSNIFGAIRRVPDDYATISAAKILIPDGDIIEIKDGHVCYENVLLLGEDYIEIRGQIGSTTMPVIQGVVQDEPVIGIASCHHITIKNLMIRTASAGWTGIELYNSNHHIYIEDNYIEQVEPSFPNFTYGIIGVLADHVYCRRNTFYGFGYGIHAYGGGANLGWSDHTNNLIENCSWTGIYWGNFEPLTDSRPRFWNNYVYFIDGYAYSIDATQAFTWVDLNANQTCWVDVALKAINSRLSTSNGYYWVCDVDRFRTEGTGEIIDYGGNSYYYCPDR